MPNFIWVKGQVHSLKYAAVSLLFFKKCYVDQPNILMNTMSGELTLTQNAPKQKETLIKEHVAILVNNDKLLGNRIVDKTTS